MTSKSKTVKISDLVDLKDDPKDDPKDDQDTKEAKILLIEDNDGDINLFEEALEKCKISNSLFVASDGESAIQYLTKQGIYKDMESPDIIFLDLKLPKISGLEVLRRIKLMDKIKRIPVIILTTSKLDQDIINSYDYYANSYIIKPVSGIDLIKSIDKLHDVWFKIVTLAPKE